MIYICVFINVNLGNIIQYTTLTYHCTNLIYNILSYL